MLGLGNPGPGLCTQKGFMAGGAIFRLPAETLDECIDEIDNLILIQHRVGSPAAEKINKCIIANSLIDK
jgi:hypothetical protein